MAATRSQRTAHSVFAAVLHGRSGAPTGGAAVGGVRDTVPGQDPVAVTACEVCVRNESHTSECGPRKSAPPQPTGGRPHPRHQLATTRGRAPPNHQSRSGKLVTLQCTRQPTYGVADAHPREAGAPVPPAQLPGDRPNAATQNIGSNHGSGWCPRPSRGSRYLPTSRPDSMANQGGHGARCGDMWSPVIYRQPAFGVS